MEITQETKEMVEGTKKDLTIYENITVLNEAELVMAGDELKVISKKFKEIDDKRKELLKPINEAKSKIQEFFKPVLVKFETAKNNIKFAIKKYSREEEEKRLDQERKLQEQVRKEEERKRKALEERAKKAEEKGNTEKAKELREKKEKFYIPAPVLQKLDVNIDKRQIRFVWRAEILDFAKLPDMYKLPNMQVLNTLAKSSDGMIKVSGVRFKKV